MRSARGGEGEGEGERRMERGREGGRGGERERGFEPILVWTSFATKWYLFIACTHWHMAVHALETDSIFFGVKSSFSMYGCTFVMIFSGMLSLSNENIDSRRPLASASIFLPGSQ